MNGDSIFRRELSWKARMGIAGLPVSDGMYHGLFGAAINRDGTVGIEEGL